MFDDNGDKQVQRNQLLAIVLMTVLVLVWSYFFIPTPTPRTSKDKVADNTPTQEIVEEDNLLSTTTVSVRMKDETNPSPNQESPVLSLPPIVEDTELLSNNEITLSNAKLELVFTRVGARLKRATVKLGSNGEDSIQLVPTSSLIPDSKASLPLGLLFSDPLVGDELNSRRWEVEESPAPNTALFRIEIPEYATIRKKIVLHDDIHLMSVTVSYTNLSNQRRLLGLDRKEPGFSLYWAPNVASGDLKKGAGQSIVWRKGETNTYYATPRIKPRPDSWYNERVLDPEWAAICSAYFTVALKPQYDAPDAWFYGTPTVFTLGVGTPRAELVPGETAEYSWQVYIGPRGRQALNEAWASLKTVHAFFTSVTIMDQFAKLLLVILVWFHDNVIANYGLAIIFLTLLVRIAMFPLTWKSMLSMKRMSALAPEVERIKQECGDDHQEMNKRIMEMYRERGVSPLGGCLPMLLQMPVFIALYRMLWTAFELRRAPFMLWINDLSEPDRLMRLPFSIPLPFSELSLESLNLLPILMAVTMVVSQKLMPVSGPAQTPQQKTLMTIMPFFFALITYNMASGLNLYILVSTLLGIAQNYIIKGIPVNVEPVKVKKPAKPRHFYDVVRAKQREINKEMRKQKQRSRRRKDSS